MIAGEIVGVEPTARCLLSPSVPVSRVLERSPGGMVGGGCSRPVESRAGLRGYPQGTREEAPDEPQAQHLVSGRRVSDSPPFPFTSIYLPAPCHVAKKLR